MNIKLRILKRPPGFQGKHQVFETCLFREIKSIEQLEFKFDQKVFDNTFIFSKLIALSGKKHCHFFIIFLSAILFSSVSNAHNCGKISPSDYYYNVERPAILKETFPKYGETPSAQWFRSFDPKLTLSLYGFKQLSCWSSLGDPLAEFLATLKLLRVKSIRELDPIQGGRLPSFKNAPTGLTLLQRAARPHSCRLISKIEDEIGRSEWKYYDCANGLPEARYLLSVVDKNLLEGNK